MKRTCNGCKAFDLHGHCFLGHPIKSTTKIGSFRRVFLEYKPLEECEKPTTISAYLLAKELKDLRGMAE